MNDTHKSLLINILECDSYNNLMISFDKQEYRNWEIKNETGLEMGSRQSLKSKTKCLEMVHFTSHTGYNLSFFANFGLAAAWFLAKTTTWVCFDSCKFKKWWEDSNHCP